MAEGAAAVMGAAPARPGAASLRDNFLWTLAGNGVGAAAQWLLLVVVARLAGERMLGQLALATATVTPIFLFTGLQLRGVVATDAAGQFRFADYLGVRALGTAAGLALAAAAAAWSGPGAAPVVLAFAAARAVEALADVHQGVLQHHERMRPIARSLMARGLLSVAIVGAVLRGGGSLAAGLALFALASAAWLVLHDLRVAAPLLRADGEARTPRLRRAGARLVAATLPLGVVALAVSLRTYLPRLFVERSEGTAELGIFAALASFVMTGTLVVSALGQSAVPRLARHFHLGELGRFRGLLVRLELLALGLGLAGVAVARLLGEPLLRLVFGPAYAARAPVLVWLMGAGLVAYTVSFLGYALTAARRFAVQLPIFVATAAATAAACAWLVPAHGLAGAAWAWGASLVVEWGLTALALTAALRARGRAA
ncbi:MAG: lipopolysaccharide biosynthesis protein [Anaeromyxobacter sp.]